MFYGYLRVVYFLEHSPGLNLCVFYVHMSVLCIYACIRVCLCLCVPTYAPVVRVSVLPGVGHTHRQPACVVTGVELWYCPRRWPLAAGRLLRAVAALVRPDERGDRAGERGEQGR